MELQLPSKLDIIRIILCVIFLFCFVLFDQIATTWLLTPFVSWGKKEKARHQTFDCSHISLGRKFSPISLCGLAAAAAIALFDAIAKSSNSLSLEYTKKEKESSSYRLAFCGWSQTIARLGTTFSDAMIRGCSQVQVVMNRKGGGHIGGRERRVKIDGSQKNHKFFLFLQTRIARNCSMIKTDRDGRKREAGQKIQGV